jgi:LysM repeat protein
MRDGAENGGRDLYAVLGVAHDASDLDIRAAFRALATKHHPDRQPGDPQAVLRFKRVNAAFQVLSDEAKRRQYDELTAPIDEFETRPSAPMPPTSRPAPRSPEPTVVDDAGSMVPCPSCGALNGTWRMRCQRCSASTVQRRARKKKAMPAAVASSTTLPPVVTWGRFFGIVLGAFIVKFGVIDGLQRCDRGSTTSPPAYAAPAPTLDETVPLPPPIAARTYVVQPGDGWYAIAAANRCSVENLVAANGANAATTIHPGDILALPPAAGGGTPSPRQAEDAKAATRAIKGAGWSFDVPASWVSPSTTEADAFARAVDAVGGVAPNVNLQVNPYDGAIGPLVDASLARYPAQGIHLISRQSVNAVAVLLEAVIPKVGGPAVRSMQFVLATKGRAFVLSCAGANDAFASLQPTCERIFLSLRAW